MAWAMLIIAGLLEVVWAFAMKQSEGFTRPVWSVFTALAMLLSFGLLSLSMRSLPLSVAYMAWTGVGAVGAFVVGAVALGEAVSATRLTAALFIVSGLALMNLASR